MLKVNRTKADQEVVEGKIAAKYPKHKQLLVSNIHHHPNGFQVVVVLGEFVGGEVVFSDDYTDGNLIIIPNRHGTIFVGKNSKVIHRVFSVLSGNRTIIAFWARSSIAEYSKHVLDRGAEWNDCRRIRDERVEILNLLRQSTSELNKKERKIGITMLKKLWTIQDERVGSIVHRK